MTDLVIRSIVWKIRSNDTRMFAITTLLGKQDVRITVGVHLQLLPSVSWPDWSRHRKTIFFCYLMLTISRQLNQLPVAATVWAQIVVFQRCPVKIRKKKPKNLLLVYVELSERSYTRRSSPELSLPQLKRTYMQNWTVPDHRWSSTSSSWTCHGILEAALVLYDLRAVKKRCLPFPCNPVKPIIAPWCMCLRHKIPNGSCFIVFTWQSLDVDNELSKVILFRAFEC